MSQSRDLPCLTVREWLLCSLSIVLICSRGVAECGCIISLWHFFSGGGLDMQHLEVYNLLGLCRFKELQISTSLEFVCILAS